MKYIKTTLLAILVSTHLPVLANGASQNFGAASKHTSMATKHSVKGSVQVASAAVAVPLVVAGSVGLVSVAAGVELLDKASKPVKAKTCSKCNPCQPLEISEVTITVDRSPRDVMKNNNQ